MSLELFVYPVGHHAVGKTEVCDYLADRYDFDVIETGAMVRGLYAERPEEMADFSIGNFVRHTEATHPGFFDEKLSEKLETVEKPNVLVNGMRSITSIEALKNRFASSIHATLWIDAAFELLHDRYNRREGLSLTAAQFHDLLDKDRELGLEAIRDSADFVITNDSNAEALKTK